MNSEKFFFYLQCLLAGGIVLAAALAGFDYFTRPVTRPAPYFYIREAVEERIAPRRISQFIPPDQLKVERLDETRGTASGWVTYTNTSGQIATQWFKAIVPLGSKSRGIHQLQLFRQPPTQTR